VVTLIASVGIYSSAQPVRFVLHAFGFGVLGYIFRKVDIPLVPMHFGMLLPGKMEEESSSCIVLFGW